jgi:hypothetical protein
MACVKIEGSGAAEKPVLMADDAGRHLKKPFSFA